VTRATLSPAIHAIVRPRALLGLLIPLACAALFIRLGVWQLERHLMRKAFNAGFAARLVADPVAFDSLGDPFSAEWRRVSLSGRFRYDLEQVQAGRTNGGSPGVHLLTPLERPGNDTLVIVTRGWVYSPDAGAADLARWREADTVSITGYVLTLPDDSTNVPPAGRPLRTLDRGPLAARVGAPIAEFQVVMTSDSTARADSVPRRLALPVVDTGPHFSYMLQWFAFALVAIIGGIALFLRARESAG
jgi:surfeit locus 1 family protein